MKLSINRSVFLPVVLLLAIAALLIPVAAGAQTVLVVDPGGGGDYTTIQAAIVAAQSGDTVQINAGTYTESLTIDKDLTLQGAGRATTTLDIGGVFNITSGAVLIDSGVEVTISGLTITGGNTSRGGGILNRGRLVLEDSHVVDNDASSTGGGLYNEENAVVTIENSTFSGNDSRNGGHHIANAGDLTLVHSVLKDSGTCRDCGGGGLLNVSSGNALVDSSLITNNNVGLASSGAGVGSSGTLTIRNSTLSDNTLGRSADGGGLSTFGTTVIIDSTISGNGDRFGNPNPVPNPSIDTVGGGISVFDGSLTLINVTVTDNIDSRSGSSLVASAGGVFVRSGGAAAVLNSVIAGNTSVNSGRDDVSGSFLSDGYNLIGDGTGSTGFNGPEDLVGTGGSPIDALLGPLQDNGGPTPTHALSVLSPAIDTADPACQAPRTDQRGVARPQGQACDMGAFELTTAEAIADLIGDVEDLNLGKGISNSLIAKLDNAHKKLTDGNDRNDGAAVNALEAFINQVQAQAGKQIPQADGDSLIAAAQQIINLLAS